MSLLRQFSEIVKGKLDSSAADDGSPQGFLDESSHAHPVLFAKRSSELHICLSEQLIEARVSKKPRPSSAFIRRSGFDVAALSIGKQYERGQDKHSGPSRRDICYLIFLEA